MRSDVCVCVCVCVCVWVVVVCACVCGGRGSGWRREWGRVGRVGLVVYQLGGCTKKMDGVVVVGFGGEKKNGMGL